jgi:DNA-binding transcriptional regulator YdaS (Cro superfamily)
MEQVQQVWYGSVVLSDDRELNRRQVARIAGINTSLFQQYVDGVKTPSAERLKDIEYAIRRLGKELADVSLS